MPTPSRDRGGTRFALQATVAFVLWLLTFVYAGRILRYAEIRLDLGGRDIATLSPSTRAYLSDLRRPLSLTYFVSARDAMPARLKGMEGEVRRLLRAFRLGAPGYIDYQILDPDVSGQWGAEYAAVRGASPFSVRDIRQDEHSQQKVWSSLVLSCAGYPDVLIQEIVPEDLSSLQALIVQRLKMLQTPAKPVFAVAAPASFTMLPSLLGEYGRVVEVDLDRQAPIPPRADVLFWVQPARVTGAQVRELRRFVASGRSVVLAGSPYVVDCEKSGEHLFRARLLSRAWASLISPLGLKPQADLLTDRNTGPIPRIDKEGAVHQVQAPFLLRCLPAFRNNKSLAEPAMGSLLFGSAGALAVDPLRVEAAGFQPEVVATTTEEARAAPLPQGVFREIDSTDQVPVGKQNLAVLLKSSDPWGGQILVLASASLFRDDLFDQGQYAHRRFLRNVVETFAAPGRLARARIERPGPPALRATGSAQRLFWRGAVVFLVPLFLLVLGLRQVSGTGCMRAQSGAGRRTVLRTACALGLLFLSVQLWRSRSRIYLDLTADGFNTLGPLIREMVKRYPRKLHAELFLTSRSLLPASMKSVEPRLRGWLQDLDLPFRTVRPGGLSAAQRTALRARGVRPFEVRTVRGDSLVSRRVWSALRISDGKGSETIPQLDARSLDHFGFLLAAAIHRLKFGRGPRIGVVSESPRLSPAEAYEDYQQKGLSAPRGADVYSAVEDLLLKSGYRISPVSRLDPEFPGDMDLLLWLQPRHDSSRLILQLSRYLASGGRAIVALQHFNIEQRQYRGAGFKTVYWPQPQYQDLDRYLEFFGVKQVREVLMDRTHSRLSLETQVNRVGNREYDDQEVALPFLIRATGEDFSRTSPITRYLGDLLFIWGNRFSLNRKRLEASGVRARVLVTTTSHAWSYAWKGGWLPKKIFEPQRYLPGPQPLTVLLRGRFPRVGLQTGPTGLPVLHVLPSEGREKPGSLLLIGCSEMFKNADLYAPGFQHDQFLLNAVADLTYGSKMAGLQARHRTVRGFVLQTPEAEITWRILVVALGPVLLFLFGLVRYLDRHRAVRL